ncbi:ATP-binding cassette domain-containing protein [Rossellomorea vietnamensis]|uniref:ATP-binding cassette domain-containing protein n=1 Tax=Rossellomorea vietnamensis TaxID=218284 RepID=A0A6I6UMK1_9BACI|nr:ABC transporter ATP-binding protein [Rossellomorea vietnamensis]QHE59793.1 ATP-binding cassette domain-containing protein [Rossellomorea vietnamensis]
MSKSENAHLFKVYIWALSFIKPYRLPFGLIVLSSIFITAIELVIPKFIQFFIDVIVPKNNITLFFSLLGCTVVLLFIMLYLSTVRNKLQHQVQEKAARDLHYSIFQHLRKLGFSYFEKHPVGETLSLMNTEVTAVQELYRRYLPFMVQEIIFSVIALFILFSLNVKLALIIIPSFLLYYLVGPKFERKASILSKEFSTNRIGRNKKIYESISALIEVRSYNSEDWENNRLNEKINMYNKSMIKAFFYAYVRGTIRRLSYYVGAMAILFYGSILVRSGTLSVGEFSAFMIYYFTAMHRLTSVVTSLTEQRVLMYQIDKIYQFINIMPEIKDSDSPLILTNIKGDVNFKNVHFQYPTTGKVIKGFNLSAKAGQRIAFVGTSGNGKSTLLKLMGRFYDPNEGEILIDNVSLKDMKLSQLRDSIGYVFQEVYLFATTVRENIRFGNPGATDEQIFESAKAAYAHDFIMELEDGYDTLIGERGVKLSGGQKQRISIARMLLKNPTIILLDEATSALDNISEIEVQNALTTLLKGKTTFTVAHRITTIQDYDQIIVLNQGKVAEKGTYDELMDKEGIFYRLCKGQQKELNNQSLPVGG